MHTFVTADQHFFHANIIKFTNRPYASVEEMNADYIDKWNSVVTDNDLIYHLGDLALTSDISAVLSVLRQLNGNIVLLYNAWHHDKYWARQYEDIRKHSDTLVLDQPMKVITRENVAGDITTIMLSHYPLEEWEAKHYGAVHLHGHSHGNAQTIANRYDVGVDVTGGFPVNIQTFI